jgi:hypothetical protein
MEVEAEGRKSARNHLDYITLRLQGVSIGWETFSSPNPTSRNLLPKGTSDSGSKPPGNSSRSGLHSRQLCFLVESNPPEV